MPVKKKTVKKKATKKKTAAKKQPKMKTTKGDEVDFPKEIVEEVLVRAGLAKQHVSKTAKLVGHEAAKVAKQGVVTAASFEKVLLSSLKVVHKEMLDTAKKVAHTALSKKKLKKK